MVNKQYVLTSFGDIAYLESGDVKAPPVLFVHGIPTSSYLWRHVMEFLSSDFYCIAPDLMGLGDTRVPPEADIFHMEAQAEMLSEFMSKLGHRSFSVVCHDQGGAAAQILCVNQKHKIRSFIITDAVCYDNWPVPAILQYQRLLRLPVLSGLLIKTRIVHMFETISPFSAFRRGVLKKHNLTKDTIEEYLRPLIESSNSRKRFIKFLLAGNSDSTMKVVSDLKRFDRPTQILWAADDYYVSPSWGRKLFEDITGAKQFELIPFCGHFWQEERPLEFAVFMKEFLFEHGLGEKKL